MARTAAPVLSMMAAALLMAAGPGTAWGDEPDMAASRNAESRVDQSAAAVRPAEPTSSTVEQAEAMSQAAAETEARAAEARSKSEAAEGEAGAVATESSEAAEAAAQAEAAAEAAAAEAAEKEAQRKKAECEKYTGSRLKPRGCR